MQTSEESRWHDDALYNAWAVGNDAAGAALVTRYSNRLRRYFDSRRTENTEDLVQSTFLRLYEGHRTYRGGFFRAFLFGIARNVFLEYLHERYRLKGTVPLDEYPDAELQHVWLEELEGQRLLIEALASLPQEDQRILEMFYWRGLKSREIALALDVPQPTTRGRIAAARRRFAQNFSTLSNPPTQGA
jgi:RNA polymerase sigma factor (sigma-70 family)